MSDSRNGPVVIQVCGDGPDDVLSFGLREAYLHRCGVRLVQKIRTGSEGTQASAMEALQLLMARVEEVADPEVEVTAALVSGDGVDSVLDAGRDAHVVVVQHREVLHLVNALTWSTADGRADIARPPVVCLPAAGPLRPVGRPVTVGVKTPKHSDFLLQKALDVARERRSSLQIVHTWGFPKPYDDIILDRVGVEWEASARSEIDAAVARIGGSAGVEVTVDVHHGDACAGLLSHTAASELVVIDVHGARTSGGYRLGRVARALLYGSSCPVLILPVADLGAARGPSLVSR